MIIKKIFTIIILSILLALFFSGCINNKDDNEKAISLIGSWMYEEGQMSDKGMIWETTYYNLYENSEFSIIKSYQINQKEYELTFFGSYNVSNGKITFYYENNIENEITNYTYQLQNNQLILTPPIDEYRSYNNLILLRYRDTPITFEKIT